MGLRPRIGRAVAALSALVVGVSLVSGTALAQENTDSDTIELSVQGVPDAQGLFPSFDASLNVTGMQAAGEEHTLPGDATLTVQDQRDVTTPWDVTVTATDFNGAAWPDATATLAPDEVTMIPPNAEPATPHGGTLTPDTELLMLASSDPTTAGATYVADYDLTVVFPGDNVTADQASTVTVTAVIATEPDWPEKPPSTAP